MAVEDELCQACSKKPPMKIVGFGHPLLDISSHVDKGFLKKYQVPLGSCNLANQKQLTIFEELSQRRDVEFVPGGAAMNTIRVMRWMLRVHGGCAFVGSLGDDEFGCILERALTKGGVSSYFSRCDDKPTGTCACLIVEKERSLLANLGAALEFTMEHLMSPKVMKAIEEAELFYCEGFFLNTVSCPQNALFIGAHCATNNKTFTFNLSAPYLCHIFKDRWAQVMPYIDIVFGSRVDIEAYGEAFEWEEKEIVDLMRKMVRLPKVNMQKPRMVVITGGSEATFVCSGDVLDTYTPPVVPINEIVDTNGAGDAFVGGFLSYFALGLPLERCVTAGHATAGEVIRNNGCTFGDVPPAVPLVVARRRSELAKAITASAP